MRRLTGEEGSKLGHAVSASFVASAGLGLGGCV